MVPKQASARIDYKDYTFKRHGLIMRFFDRYLAKFIFSCKMPIVFGCFLWFCLCLYFGFKIPRTPTGTNMLSSELAVQ